jgi:iron complex transport system substrate-binding protein
LAALLLLTALVGCSKSAGTEKDAATTTSGTTEETPTAPVAPGRVTFTDDLGFEVSVENPQRVVACMGSFAGAWELAGGTLIGASDDAFTDYGIASEGIEQVGDLSSINVESLIALEPDFVIMTGASGGRAGATAQADLRDTLVNSGVTVAYFTVTTFEDYERVFTTFCEITGRDDLYQTNCADVAAKIASIKAAVPAGEAPRVLILTTYSGGTRAQASDTQTGAIFRDLGAINLTDENPGILREFSLEAIIEMNPDFIFVIPMGNNEAATIANLEEMTVNNPAWATLSAVQEGRYLTLDPEHFLYKPNNKWDEAYQIAFDHLYQ